MKETPINVIVEKMKLLAEDAKAYSSRVQAKYVIDDSILELLNTHALKYKIFESDDHPLVKIDVDMGSFEKELFKINYSFRIQFSKFLSNVTHDYFSFEVVNRDNNRVSGMLSNDSYHPLTHSQYKFYEEYKLILKKRDYVRLSMRDLNYVICSEIRRFEGLAFFGDQPTLEMLVFNDFFNLIPEES